MAKTKSSTVPAPVAELAATSDAIYDRIMATPLEPYLSLSNNQLEGLREAFAQLALIVDGLAARGQDEDECAALDEIVVRARSYFDDLEFNLREHAWRAAGGSWRRA